MDLQLDRAGETAPSDGASRSVPQLIESALAGRATMLLLVGRNGDDVHSVIDSLVRPTAVARGVRDLVEVTGLAWKPVWSSASWIVSDSTEPIPRSP